LYTSVPGISCRVTDEQLAAIEARRGSLRRSDWLIGTILGSLGGDDRLVDGTDDLRRVEVLLSARQIAVVEQVRGEESRGEWIVGAIRARLAGVPVPPMS
jgi:hypothetical protein